MNYFDSKDSAERYAVGRPDFHANTIGHIKSFLNIAQKLPFALDVACGTGLSAKALLSIAEEVYGTDASAEMLKIAEAKDRIHYVVSAAETQPFEDGKFDLITVSSAIHWFNIDAFLAEANRLLKPGGWLVIYENYFAGKIDKSDDFVNWVNQVYLDRFPSPPRNRNYDWSAENLHSRHFTIDTPDGFENPVSFSKKQLIAYFITQSNIISAVDSGRYTYEEIENWLNSELHAYFENDAAASRIVHYGNWIKYLQKTNF